jgi:hypothetical protein
MLSCVGAQTSDDKFSRHYRPTRRLSKPKNRVLTPEGITEVIRALETACTHIRVRTAVRLVIGAGALTPATPVIASCSRAVDEPEGFGRGI